ncbi:MAG: hypothetical protein N3A02_03255, partial [Rectinema sp.]|nr:hypothetical protein [Rectinema sp.]
ILSFVYCGMPSFNYLYSPHPFFSTCTACPLRLEHDVDNDIYSSDIFKGYDIYYHIFDSPSAASSCRSQLLSYSGSGNAFVSHFSSSSYAYPFVRLLRISVSDAIQPSGEPLVVPTPTRKTFIIDLNAISSWSISCNEDPSYQFHLKRILNSQQSRFDFFDRSSYHQGDEDYTGSTNPSGPLYIIVFAVAVGDSSESIGQKVYSSPVIIPADQSESIINFNLQ